MANFKVADLKLADEGRLRIEWAESRMPVLMALREKYKKEQPLQGAPHRRLPARHQGDRGPHPHAAAPPAPRSRWSGCNPLSTQDDVAAALAAEGTSIYAWHGLTKEEFYWCIERTLDFKPTLTLDDGADLIFTVHSQASRSWPRTSSAAPRRPPPACTACARWPPTASCSTRSSPSTTPRPSGTSTTSTARGSRRSTASCAPSSVLLAGKTFVVAGYGHCGRGVAHARQGHGRQRRRHRDQADRGAQGDARGLPRDADGRGRQGRRHLHHRHRHEGHHRRAPLRRR